MFDVNNLVKNIKINEGFSGVVYKCSEGFDTIGYGTKLQITKFEAELLLKNRLIETIKLIRFRVNFLESLPNEKQVIVYEMAYQIGVYGVTRFRKMLSALEKKDYDLASKEMLDSLWAKQTPNRAKKLAKKMAEKIITSDIRFDVV